MLVDGQMIQFLALRIGSYTYTDQTTQVIPFLAYDSWKTVCAAISYTRTN